jgi:hypothetical protein
VKDFGKGKIPFLVHSVLTGSGADSTSIQTLTVALYSLVNFWGVNLTTNLHLVPRYRKVEL